MADYMYLMARLPYLGVFPDTVSFNVEELLQLEEFSTIKETKKMAAYTQEVAQIEDEIYTIRTQKDYSPKILPIQIVKANPLQREIEILKIKWQMVDNLNTFEADREWLWTYKEKLEIIQRVTRFNKLIGTEIYQQKVEEVRSLVTKQNGAQASEG